MKPYQRLAELKEWNGMKRETVLELLSYEPMLEG